MTAVCLAEHKYSVTCLDLDKDKVALLNTGCSPIYKPGLEELMGKNKERLSYTSNYKEAYKDADVILIGVGTPEKQDGSADLSHVFRVAEQISGNITKNCVVVVKSTVPIGTNEKIDKIKKMRYVCLLLLI